MNLTQTSMSEFVPRIVAQPDLRLQLTAPVEMASLCAQLRVFASWLRRGWIGSWRGKYERAELWGSIGDYFHFVGLRRDITGRDFPESYVNSFAGVDDMGIHR
jgi:hypothetical protein